MQIAFQCMFLVLHRMEEKQLDAVFANVVRDEIHLPVQDPIALDHSVQKVHQSVSEFL